ncbi:hypothetical protein FA213_29970 [Pseudomonas aeruginosa]|nr:hypothetical protein [Pseudomonas aeruginosa]
MRSSAASDVYKRQLQDGFGWSNGVTLQLLRLYGPGAGR